jgi:hypothetical protein
MFFLHGQQSQYTPIAHRKRLAPTMRVFAVRTLLLLLSAVFAVNADDLIYPDDHWNYATRLTEENFESTVTAEMDAGRTMMVRWIASPK